MQQFLAFQIEQSAAQFDIDEAAVLPAGAGSRAGLRHELAPSRSAGVSPRDRQRRQSESAEAAQFRLESQDLTEGGIGLEETAGVIGDMDAVAGRLIEEAITLLALRKQVLSMLALGDVDQNADVVECLTAIAANGHAARTRINSPSLRMYRFSRW